MRDPIVPGHGIIFMKVGIHAQETLADIIERKKKEISDAGFGLWGYGGNTCHPRTMVQPFAQEYAQKNLPIFLCMEEMVSSHWGEPVVAAEYSADGENWTIVPEAIQVRGSRFALKITSLDEVDLRLDLARTRVAIGLKRGRNGSRYVSGRVDKACLDIMAEEDASVETRSLPIRLAARLADPYAVFLRGGRKA